MAHGNIIWNELVSTDVEKAKKFYAAAMGWTYDASPLPGGGTYWVIKLGEQRIGGIFPYAGPGAATMPDFWLPYIAVDDVDASVKKAVANGAKVMKPAMDVPNVGRMVMLTEPGGASVAWMKPAAM